MTFKFESFKDVQRSVAMRFRLLRVERGYTRKTLAEMAGVSAASLKRFEVSGEVSFGSLLRLAEVLDALDGFQLLFPPPVAKSLDEIEAIEMNRRSAKLRRGKQ